MFVLSEPFCINMLVGDWVTEPFIHLIRFMIVNKWVFMRVIKSFTQSISLQTLIVNYL